MREQILKLKKQKKGVNFICKKLGITEDKYNEAIGIPLMVIQEVIKINPEKLTLTLEFLKEKSACSTGINWFLEQKTTNVLELLDNAIATGDINILRYADWGICRIFTKEQKVKYAIYSAELVLDIFEKRYPEDNRPRKAIEAARGYLINQSEENRIKCRTAAAAAAYAAAAAAAAADAAAYATAADAVYATAADAVYACAAYATAARIELFIKILSYGKELLNKG